MSAVKYGLEQFLNFKRFSDNYDWANQRLCLSIPALKIINDQMWTLFDIVNCENSAEMIKRCILMREFSQNNQAPYLFVPKN